MSIQSIKETCIYFQNLEKAREFYHGILGLEIISEVPGKHIFFRAGASVLLCFNPDDSKLKTSPPPHYASGKQHFAFEVADGDYAGWKKKVIENNIEITDTVIWENGKESFYFNDPEENVCEIIPPGIWD